MKERTLQEISEMLHTFSGLTSLTPAEIERFIRENSGVEHNQDRGQRGIYDNKISER